MNRASQNQQSEQGNKGTGDAQHSRFMDARGYNDAEALTNYVIKNYGYLMTDLERRARVPLLADGLKLFFERVRNRILSEHADVVVLHRCEKCGCLCRTPEACLCPVCNHTWYERRKAVAKNVAAEKRTRPFPGRRVTWSLVTKLLMRPRK